MEPFIQQLHEASKGRNACRITLKGEPFPRVIHPYGVCQTSGNKVVIVCQQVAGFTKAGRTAGFRNLQFTKLESIEVLDEKFQLDEGFQPQDVQYKEWVYHI